jgi:hypothetical protein
VGNVPDGVDGTDCDGAEADRPGTPDEQAVSAVQSRRVVARARLLDDMRASWPTAGGLPSSDDPCGRVVVAHLGHRVEFTTVGNLSTATIGAGVGAVEVGDGVLTLHASGPDTEALDRVQDVLGRHLERFGVRQELTVVWTRTGDADGAPA